MKRNIDKRLIFSKSRQTYRLTYGLVLLVSLGALGSAWYLQNIKDLAPCPLCIMQRFGYLGLAIFSLIGLLKGSLKRFGNGLAALIGIAGAGVAGYHNWKLLQPKFECGIDPVQNFVNDLPTSTLWPDMFMATGLCGAKLPLIFGISIPMWSLLGLSTLTLVFVWRYLRG